MNALGKSALIALATTSPSLSVRRSAAHMLYGLGCFTGTIQATDAAEKARAQELAAKAVANEAIRKAAGAQS